MKTVLASLEQDDEKVMRGLKLPHQSYISACWESFIVNNFLCTRPTVLIIAWSIAYTSLVYKILIKISL